MINSVSVQGKLLDKSCMFLHLSTLLSPWVPFQNKGLTWNLTQIPWIVTRKDASIARGTRFGSLYAVYTCISPSENQSSLLSNLQVWHERLAHVHRDGILQKAGENVLQGLRIAPQAMPTQVCEVSIMVKMRRFSTPRSSGILDLIHIDVARHLSVTSKGGAVGSRNFRLMLLE